MSVLTQVSYCGVLQYYYLSLSVFLHLLSTVKPTTNRNTGMITVNQIESDFIERNKHLLSLRLTFCLSPQTQSVIKFSHTISLSFFSILFFGSCFYHIENKFKSNMFHSVESKTYYCMSSSQHETQKCQTTQSTCEGAKTLQYKGGKC